MRDLQIGDHIGVEEADENKAVISLPFGSCRFYFLAYGLFKRYPNDCPEIGVTGDCYIPDRQRDYGDYDSSGDRAQIIDQYFQDQHLEMFYNQSPIRAAESYSDSSDTNWQNHYIPLPTVLTSGYVYIVEDDWGTVTKTEYYIDSKGQMFKVFDDDDVDIRYHHGEAKKYHETNNFSATIWVAYSKAQWTEDFFEKMANPQSDDDRKIRDKVMKYVDCSGFSWNGEDYSYPRNNSTRVSKIPPYIKYIDNISIFKPQRNGYLEIKNKFEEIEPLYDYHNALKSYDNLVKDIQKISERTVNQQSYIGDVFFILDDPIGCADVLTDELAYNFYFFNDLVNSLKTGESHIFGNKVKGGWEEKNEISNLHRLAVDTRNAIDVLCSEAGNIEMFYETYEQGMRMTVEAGFNYEALDKVLGVSERNHIKYQINILRDNLGDFLRSDYYDNCFIPYQENLEYRLTYGKGKISDHLYMLTRFPDDVDKNIEIYKKDKAIEDPWLVMSGNISIKDNFLKEVSNLFLSGLNLHILEYEADRFRNTFNRVKITKKKIGVYKKVEDFLTDGVNVSINKFLGKLIEGISEAGIRISKERADIAGSETSRISPNLRPSIKDLQVKLQNYIVGDVDKRSRIQQHYIVYDLTDNYSGNLQEINRQSDRNWISVSKFIYSQSDMSATSTKSIFSNYPNPYSYRNIANTNNQSKLMAYNKDFYFLEEKISGKFPIFWIKLDEMLSDEESRLYEGLSDEKYQEEVVKHVLKDQNRTAALSSRILRNALSSITRIGFAMDLLALKNDLFNVIKKNNKDRAVDIIKVLGGFLTVADFYLNTAVDPKVMATKPLSTVMKNIAIAGAVIGVFVNLIALYKSIEDGNPQSIMYKSFGLMLSGFALVFVIISASVWFGLALVVAGLFLAFSEKKLADNKKDPFYFMNQKSPFSETSLDPKWPYIAPAITPENVFVDSPSKYFEKVIEKTESLCSASIIPNFKIAHLELIDLVFPNYASVGPAPVNPSDIRMNKPEKVAKSLDISPYAAISFTGDIGKKVALTLSGNAQSLYSTDKEEFVRATNIGNTFKVSLKSPYFFGVSSAKLFGFVNQENYLLSEYYYKNILASYDNEIIVYDERIFSYEAILIKLGNGLIVECLVCTSEDGKKIIHNHTDLDILADFEKEPNSIELQFCINNAGASITDFCFLYRIHLGDNGNIGPVLPLASRSDDNYFLVSCKAKKKSKETTASEVNPSFVDVSCFDFQEFIKLGEISTPNRVIGLGDFYSSTYKVIPGTVSWNDLKKNLSNKVFNRYSYYW